MELRFFSISVVEPGNQAEELNEFLRLHPHAMVERHLVSDGQQSLWAVCCSVPNAVRRHESATTARVGKVSSKKRVDYRDILEPEHFARYAVLRELRNQLASDQGIPAYSIFSNAQLAEMAQINHLTRQEMAAIDGVGEKRVERYAEQFINALEQL